MIFTLKTAVLFRCRILIFCCLLPTTQTHDAVQNTSKGNYEDGNLLQHQKNYSVLNVSNQKKPSIDCVDGTKLVATGPFLKLSDLSAKFDRCPGDKLHIIEIFATDTVIIDHDMEFTSVIVLAIMAPTWSVEGKRSIQFVGSNGQPSGSFLGLGKFFFNGANLTIVAKGGAGDDSQDAKEIPSKGGDGGNGGNGGAGGATGDIRIFNLEEPPLIEVKQIKGSVNSKVKEHIKEIMNDYKSYLAISLKDNATQNNILDFLLTIIKNPSIMEQYERASFAIYEDFMTLEKNFNVLYGEPKLMFLYQEFQKHIESQANKTINPEGDEGDELKFWNVLYASTHSKMCILERMSNGRFISNIDGFLDMFLNNIEKLREVDHKSAVDDYRSNFNNNMNQNIQEAQHVITKNIAPVLNASAIKTKKDVEEVIGRIRKMKENANKRQKELIKAQETLGNNIILHHVAGGLSVLGSLLGFCGVLGEFGGSISNLAATATEQFAGDAYNGAGLEIKTKTLQNILSENPKNKIKGFMNDISWIKSVIRDGSTKSKYISSRQLNAISSSKNLWSKYNVADYFKKEIYNKSHSHGRSRRWSDSTNNKVMEGLDRVGKVVPLLTSTYSYIKTIEQDKETLNVVVDTINKNKEFISLLNQYEETVNDVILPLLGEMSNLVSNLSASLKDQVLPKIVVIGNSVQNFLRKLRTMLKSVTKIFQAEKSFTSNIELVEDATNKMITIYKNIQKLQQVKKFTNFVADTNFNDPIQDKNLSFLVTKMELALQNNIILLEYTESINQLKHFVFPLIKSFFIEFKLPEVLKPMDTKEAAVTDAINQIESFRMKLLESRIYITNFDQLKHTAEFFSTTINGPFFVWKNSQNHRAISRLLAGKEAMFVADLSQHHENAIKFNYLDLLFKSEKDQKSLDKLLENVLVSMTHTGSNYYNCNNKTYMVLTESQNMQFSIAKINNNPVKMNSVYTKLRNGDFMLSPFTTWKIKLIFEKIVDEELLKQHNDDVYLELVGQGEYFDNEPDVCDQDLESNYELVNGY